jgi:hypothetical protein
MTSRVLDEYEGDKKYRIDRQVHMIGHTLTLPLTL